MMHIDHTEPTNPGRRRLVAAVAVAGAAALAGAFSPSVLAGEFWSLPRTLWIVRADNGEQLKSTYFADGRLVWENYIALCRLMRDRNAGVAAYMDPSLFDILRGMQGWFEAHGIIKPIVLTSGYRTTSTNALLVPEGASLSSLHMRGSASDIRIPDIPTRYLWDLGRYLRGGGVGYYPSKNMVHVDTGREHAWTGRTITRKGK